MQKISHEESKTLAASLISGIRNSLLVSLDDGKVNEDANKTPAVTDTSNHYYGNKFKDDRNSILESRYDSFLQDRRSNTCFLKNSSCCFSNNDFMNSGSGSYETASSWHSPLSAEPHTIRNAHKDTMNCNVYQDTSYPPRVMDDDTVTHVNKSGKEYENHSKYGKKCPKCFEINDKDANWCMECGKAIISVEIRKYDAFEEDGYIPTASRSVPLKSISYEEDHISSNFKSSNRIWLCDNVKVSEKKKQEDPFGVFEFEPDIENLSVTHDSAISPHTRKDCDSKKIDGPYLYAFDDLLYPNYAIQDPVNGYILPSSCILSDPAYYQPVYLNGCPQGSSKEQVIQKEFLYPKFKKQRNKKNRSRKQVKNESRHIPLSQNKYEIFDTVNATVEDLLFLNLPEEVILFVLSKLPLSDIVQCSRVCKQLCRITSDPSLWKVIKLKKKQNLTDSVLSKIAHRLPSHLSITQCNGKRLTEDSLRTLFRCCSESLQVLEINACSGGVLVGETILLHVSSRCKNITKLDVSWSNVSNVGVQSVSSALRRIVEISLNGCQGISDEAVHTLAEQHGKTLEVVELFGCFNVTPSSIAALAQHCKGLRKLNLGQCHKVNGPALSTIARNLKELQTLDIRGCKQIRDGALKEIVRNCQKLIIIVIANCPQITDQSLISIASYLPQLQCLDACGCGKVSDKGVHALARRCHSLKTIDFSSTKVTGKSVSAIGNYCYKTLASLKLSFCHSITDHCLHVVVSKCKRLTMLHLYGCKPIRNIYKLMEMNTKLKIERESLR